MHWFKREIWKAGIAIAGMLLLLVLMVWVSVSAVGAHERTSGFAGPVTVTVQATPTEDATVTALNKAKLAQEVQQLKNQNEPDLLGWLRTNAAVLVVVIGGLIGLFRWFEDRRSEREKRDEDRFQAVVAGLGSNNIEARVGAAIRLRTFLRPGYEQFYSQAFDLSVAHLRLRKADPETKAASDAPLPLDSLSQALITVFKESFPRARKEVEKQSSLFDSLSQALITVFKESFPRARKEVEKQCPLFDPQLLDASRIRLDNAYIVQSDLKCVWLREADLSKTHLNRADLRGAYLRRAHLRGTYLGDTDLRKANLSFADLSGADLSGAKLSGANLQGAIYNTKAIQEKNAQEELVTINRTQWPQGFDPKVAGSICVDC